MKKLLFALSCSAFLIFTFAGCKKAGDTSKNAPGIPQPVMVKKMAPAAAPSALAGFQPAPAESKNDVKEYSAVTERKVIYTANLRLEVEKYDDAVEEIKKMVVEKGGFVADSHVDVDPNGVKSGTIRIRIPSDNFNDTISGIKGIGKVKYEAEHGDDITEEYFDLETRLGTAKKMEERLLDLLQKQTKSVKDLLEVEKELGRVREDIELKEGRKRFLDDRLSLSTITIELFEPHTYTSSVFDPLKDMWSSIWGNLISSFAAVASFIFTALPWAILIGLVAWIAIKLARRWLRKTAKSKD